MEASSKEATQLLEDLTKVCIDHDTETVLTAASNLLASAILDNSRQKGWTMERAMVMAHRFGMDLSEMVEANWGAIVKPGSAKSQ